jgi:HEAT repeat protein
MALTKRVRPIQQSGDRRQGSRSYFGLVEQLDDANPVARRWAARDLAAFPEATEALGAALRREHDASVREVMLTSLIGLGDEVAVSILLECLRSPDVPLRNQAGEALQELPQQLAPVIGPLLRDSDPEVRILAVTILRGLRNPEIEDWLLALMVTETHVNVCGAAIDVLGEVATERSRLPLLDLRTRFADEAYIRFAVDLVLQRIGAT